MGVVISSPFGNEIVIELPHGKFTKALQWQEEKTGKQYATWWENIPSSSFKQEASWGYTYVADFDVVSITAAKDFEDRHVVRIEQPEEIDEVEAEEVEAEEVEAEEVEAEEVEAKDDQGDNGNGWGGGPVVQDQGKEASGANEWGASQGASQSGTGW
jgi:hypothetical protein